MAGLTFSLNGKLDPSFGASLNKAVAEAQAASLRIQNSLRSQISALDRSMKGMDTAGADYAAAAEKRASLQNSLLTVQNAQYISAARRRVAALEAEAEAVRRLAIAEKERYAASLSPTGAPSNPRAGMEADQAAWDAKIAKLKTARAEAQRYAEALAPAGGFANPRAGMEADQAAWDAKIAKLKTARAEAERYARLTGGFVNPRAGMAADQSSWEAKLAAFRASKGSSGLTAAGRMEKFGKNAEKAIGHVSGLNLILRETLVVFREIGRGNWGRVPGSLSLILQGLALMKNIPLLLLGAWTFAIGGIIGSFFIFFHRVKSLAEDLRTTLISTFNPEHVARYQGRLEIVNQLQKDIADSARSIQEAHDSVSDSIDRQMNLTRSRIAFERELLEIQKANALAAVRNPAEREAIEKKYSTLILAKKKEERDEELKSMQARAKALPGEITRTEAELKHLTQETGYVTEQHDAVILRQRQEASAAYAQYRAGTGTGATEASDQALISQLRARQEFLRHAGAQELGDDDQARLSAAQQRIKNAGDAKNSLAEWLDAGDDRARAQSRVKELTEKAKKDADELTRLIGTKGDNGAVVDEARKNLQSDQQDIKLEQERLKRIDAGRPLQGREVTERERVGLGSPTVALLDQTKIIARNTTILANHVQRQPKNAQNTFFDPLTGF